MPTRMATNAVPLAELPGTAQCRTDGVAGKAVAGATRPPVRRTAVPVPPQPLLALAAPDPRRCQEGSDDAACDPAGWRAAQQPLNRPSL